MINFGVCFVYSVYFVLLLSLVFNGSCTFDLSEDNNGDSDYAIDQ